MATTRETELLPCPFCGGDAKSYVDRDDDRERYGEVSCSECSASTRGPYLHWMDNTDAEIASMYAAIAAWNTRAK